MKITTQEIWNAGQSWHLEATANIGTAADTRRLRIRIRRNAYDGQSKATVEAWTDQEGWAYLTQIPITETEASQISYVENRSPELVGILERTRDTLIEKAETILA